MDDVQSLFLSTGARHGGSQSSSVLVNVLSRVRGRVRLGSFGSQSQTLRDVTGENLVVALVGSGFSPVNLKQVFARTIGIVADTHRRSGHSGTRGRIDSPGERRGVGRGRGNRGDFVTKHDGNLGRLTLCLSGIVEALDSVLIQGCLLRLRHLQNVEFDRANLGSGRSGHSHHRIGRRRLGGFPDF